MIKQSATVTPSNNHTGFVRNVIIKALLLFMITNLLFAIWYPMPGLGRLSTYNLLFPGRQRLPYGENPDRSYNLSLYNLEAMMASHEISAAPKSKDEYRVVLIGDSSVWGFLLPPEQTLSSFLNSERLILPDRRQMRVYNLGYPVMSLTKDLLILSYAMTYQPDLIIWLLTLESFPDDKQLFPHLLKNNPEKVLELIHTYKLELNTQEDGLVQPSFWDRTIVGSRRALADLIRLQIYAVMWSATGIDQDIPSTYEPRMEDLPADESFHDLQPPHLDESDLTLDVLSAGVKMAGEIPILFINEPMFISQGENSHIRYNFFYPRWAYDDFREILSRTATTNNWNYQDMWNAIDDSEFTNSAVHLTPKGTEEFAHYITNAILELTRLSNSN